MAGKLTWRVPQWRGVAWERHRPEWEARFGPTLAEIIVRFRLEASASDCPARVDQVRTLRRIARQPGSLSVADLLDLDPDTDDRLTVQALRLYRQSRVELLSPIQLARCAEAAELELPRAAPGRRRTLDASVPLVAAVLEVLEASGARLRGDVLHDYVEAVLVAAGAVRPQRGRDDPRMAANLRKLLGRAGRLRRGRVL